MKKIIMYFCIVLIAFSLVGCNKSGTSDNVAINVNESTKFNKEEVNKAIDLVKNSFEFPACTLTELWYDEEKSNKFIEGYLENGRGSINGVDSENVIFLLSSFDVDGSGNPVLNANSTYTDYNWILIRDSKTSNWIIDDMGY